jgi:hypothetical protein
MEAQYPMAIPTEKKDLKFSTHWILLFSDMLFFASGEKKNKRKLVGETTLSSIWIRQPQEAKRMYQRIFY